jgi:hypothetical protein
VDESKLRSSKARASARLASIRRLDALASSTRDSVDHLAAAYPDHAASNATTESKAASVMEMSRSRSSCGAACFACWPISFPTSLAESPSGIERA